MEVTAEYRTIFAEESREHLEEWEAALLSLEKNPENQELIHQMFRAIHTLKGSAGFIGFDKLQKLTHELESALQDLRDGTASLSTEMIDLLFQGLDFSTRMVESFTEGREFDEDLGDFIGRLWAQSGGGAERPDRAGEQETENPDSQTTVGSPEDVSPTEATASGAAGPGWRRYRLELFIKATGREGFLRAFLIRNRLAGVATILAEDPAPEILKDTGGRFVYRMTLDTEASEEKLREAFNVDLLEITSFEELKGGAEPGGIEGSGGGEASEASAEPTPTASRATKAEEVVRVSVERLDTLLNLVGELVIQNSGFLSLAQELKVRYGKNEQIVDLETKTEALAKITRDLQDGIMKVRMLPVSNVFGRFYRVVRDLAKDRKKEIALDVYGEETEIDKKVMDRIGDPLVHLVRNAVDHGIESREQRLAAGKAPVGQIRLGAYQDGDHICIEVSDDGRGLDKQAVLNKAVEKGLVRPEEVGRLSNEQVLSLIFLPGFTTASQVSEVSGRGVGMDVVKRAIEGMGGSLRIRSLAGRGTTIIISLPLTMAIIPAVLAEVSGSTLAIPLSAVKEVLKVGEGELKSVGTRPAIRLRDEVLAVVHLREALEMRSGGNGSSAEGEDRRMPVVIVDYEEKKIGLGVDRVIGTGEIVIKSLSRHYREIEGLIGASILGNGKIALIVDVEALVRQYYYGATAENAITDSGIFSFQELNAGHSDSAKSPVGRRPTEAAAEEGGSAVGEKAAEQQQTQAPGIEAERQSQTGVDAGGQETGDRTETGDVEGEDVEVTELEVEDVEEQEPPAAGEDEQQVEAGQAENVEVLVLEVPEPSEAADEDDQQANPDQELDEELKESKGPLIEEIHNTGAIQASIALSRLTGSEVRVSFPESQIVQLGEVAGFCGGEETPVGGLYVGIEGSLDGAILMVIPVPSMLRFHERILRLAPGACTSLEEVDLSAVSELGNILASSFINAISDGAQLNVKSEVPEISVDMCQPVIDSVLARFNPPGDRILLTKALIYSEENEEVVCHLLMFLETESLRKLVSAVTRAVDHNAQA
jgi:two-component system chemotaxis sensor kinase CheA